MDIYEDVLIQGLVSGNRKIYHMIFDSMYDSLCLFVHRFIAERETCEDCAQEALISLWIHREKMKSMQHVRSFLYYVCRNKALNYLRNNRIKNEYMADALRELSDHVAFVHYVLEEEVARLLTYTEEMLAPRCRKIFNLALQGKSNSEIACLLGVSENTVKTQKKIAYKCLKNNITNIAMQLCVFFGIQ